MQHKYVASNGEILELTSAVVTVSQLEGIIEEDEVLSTEHVKYWRWVDVQEKAV